MSKQVRLDVPLHLLISKGLSLEAFLVLFLVSRKDQITLLAYINKCAKISMQTIDFLLDNSYLCTLSEKKDFKNLSLTKKSKEFFPDNNVEEWIEEWYDLFPQGVKSGGYLIRTDLKNCTTKMKKYITKYPKHTKELILEATKNYLEQMRMQDYNMCKLAPYFIEKDGMSMLNGQVEQILSGAVEKTNSFIQDI